MYRIKCDIYNTIFDLNTNDLIVTNPKLKLEANKVGECSFTIYKNHPYYNSLREMRSVIEVSDDYGTIFRGRITNNTTEFNGGKTVDIEGAMAYFNDSVVRPFSFPDDFLEDTEYQSSENVVKFFLNRLIENHNSQVQRFQRFKLGKVTVSDPNNYIFREDSDYKSTWDILKSKLFESSLGGYLCIRYEADGNYIDYLAEFDEVNPQPIEYGKNLLDLKTETDSSETYSAIIPIGAEGLTIQDIADGDVTEDIVKTGDTLYSVSAVEQIGWIYAPVSDTKWDNVTIAENLIARGTNWLSGAIAPVESLDITAVDLHFTDSQIESFRIYKNVYVDSQPHNRSETLPLTKLDIDMENPQNTKLHVGRSGRSFVADSSLEELKEEVKADSKKTNESINSIKEDVKTDTEQTTELLGAFEAHSTNAVIHTTAEERRLLNEKIADLESRLEALESPVEPDIDTGTEGETV